jgi:ribose 5-phosphate isomerase RpiB
MYSTICDIYSPDAEKKLQLKENILKDKINLVLMYCEIGYGIIEAVEKVKDDK